MKSVFVGIALGLTLTVLVTRFLRALLVGLPPTDPITVILVVGTAVSIALVGNYVPVWRATNDDPAALLRNE
jgi:ABC-type antimicrobial peptide transport system permease subunit